MKLDCVNLSLGMNYSDVTFTMGNIHICKHRRLQSEYFSLITQLASNILPFL